MNEFNPTKKFIVYGCLIAVFVVTTYFIDKKQHEVRYNNPDIPTTHYLLGEAERSDVIYYAVSRSAIEADIVIGTIDYDGLNQLTKI